jgi:hypothetical protein
VGRSPTYGAELEFRAQVSDSRRTRTPQGLYMAILDSTAAISPEGPQGALSSFFQKLGSRGSPFLQLVVILEV